MNDTLVLFASSRRSIAADGGVREGYLQQDNDREARSVLIVVLDIDRQWQIVNLAVVQG
jgi:hypothetical protein